MSHPIPKSTTPSRVVDNFSVLDWELSGEDLEAIKGIDKNLRWGIGVSFVSVYSVDNVSYHVAERRFLSRKSTGKKSEANNKSGAVGSWLHPRYWHSLVYTWHSLVHMKAIYLQFENKSIANGEENDPNY